MSYFPLFTSLSPRLLDDEATLNKQRRIINSWQAVGFAPCTINEKTEAERIAALNLKIDIEVAPREGKPLIVDMIKIIRGTTCSRAGIINADCELLGYPDLASILASVLDNAALYATRLDINDHNLIDGGCVGFDAFFFDPRRFDGIGDQGFRLGEPWWDYWFPLQFAANGGEIGLIELPIILHQAHAIRWMKDTAPQFRHLLGAVRCWETEGKLTLFFSQAGDLSENIGAHAAIATRCSRFLRNQRLTRQINFLPPALDDIEQFLKLAFRSFISKEAASEIKKELEEIKRSRSWRYTEFIRRLSAGLR